MDDEEFLKEHPSLKGMIFKPTGIVYNRNKHIVEICKVHETQLDKQIVEKVIDDMVEPPFNVKLKKELGLR